MQIMWSKDNLAPDNRREVDAVRSGPYSIQGGLVRVDDDCNEWRACCQSEDRRIGRDGRVCVALCNMSGRGEMEAEMTIFSDYAHGYLSEEDFRSACAQMDREEAWYAEHQYDEDECEEDEDDEGHDI